MEIWEKIAALFAVALFICTVCMARPPSRKVFSPSVASLPEVLKREQFALPVTQTNLAAYLPERSMYTNAQNFSNPSGTRQTTGYGFGNDVAAGLVPSVLRTVSGSCAYNVADTPGISGVSYHALDFSPPEKVRLEIGSGEDLSQRNKF